MAYRKIHDDFWTDPDMEELTPEQKYFYIYLITNPKVNQIGLYELSLKRACFETGYNIDTVSKLLGYFISEGKIIKSEISKEILVVKFYWHNKSNSPKMKTHVEQLLMEVKDTSLIQYIYGMHTTSQEEEEEEEEKEEETTLVTSKAGDWPKAAKFIKESELIADRLLEKIIFYDPTHRFAKRRPSLHSWALDIEKAIRIDGRTQEQLMFMIDYIFSGKTETANFWAPNIASGKKLRDKFDLIKNKILKERKKDGRSLSGYESRKKETDSFLSEYYSQPNG